LGMKTTAIINVKSLKEQVYDYLREQMRLGDILPGSVIDMEETSQHLGVSKTPLRDALLQLEAEGFVTIYPRRGIVVNILSLQDIKKYYDIIGALESTAMFLAFENIRDREIKTMEKLIVGMRTAIEADNFDSYYEKNLKFHDVYLTLCGNENLVKIVRTLKKRLYDFPRQKGFVKEWEAASIREHSELLKLIKQGRAAAAASFIRDVHWSFKVQEKYINRYYEKAPEFWNGRTN
jgi:DNA-binding GntR family transcriptional regulator